VSKLFGDYIRKRREALRKGSPEFSIRKVAKRIGIHHSYLSKVERGEPATLSEKRIFALAEELGDDPELLMAMNGKISEEVRRAIFESPELFSRLVHLVKIDAPAEGSSGDAELAALRSLRDMSVMKLDTDMHVLWAKPAPHWPDDLVGRKCHDALFGTSAPCPDCPAIQAMATGVYHAGEIKDHHGGAWLVGSTPLIDGDNKSDGFIHVGVDISRGKELERFRSEAERLMYHDIKSPLGGIINMARSLQDDGNLTREQVSCLAVLAQSGEQLMSQVSSSMDIHLIESGKLKYAPTKVDIATLVRDLGQNITSEARFAGIDLELSLNGRPLMDHDTVWAVVDKIMTARMLGNLTVNAFEASKVGNVVRLELATDKSVSIRVKNPDSIPESIRDRFFEKYATSGKSKGLGLGAYGAKLMAELMGGSISVESSEDRGTTVTVALPS